MSYEHDALRPSVFCQRVILPILESQGVEISTSPYLIGKFFFTLCLHLFSL